MFSGMLKFVISLKFDEERFRLFGQRFSNLMSFDKFDAVNVKSDVITDWERNICTEERLAKYPGTAGCLLSHTRLWRRAIELDQPIGIFEDDTAPTGNYTKSAELLDLYLSDIDFDLVFLSTENRDGDMENRGKIAENEHARLVRYDSREGLRQGGRGYIMTPSGARYLLKAIEQGSRTHERGHVDVFMIRHAPELVALNVVPHLIEHRDQKLSRRDELDARTS